MAVTFVSECGEDPAGSTESKLDGDDAKRGWFDRNAATWGPDCATLSRPDACRWSGARSFNPARPRCDATCCDLHDIGHNAPYLSRFCTEGGKVAALTIRDGC